MSFTNRTTAAAKTEIPDGHISHSVFSELLTQDLSDLTLVGNTCTESSFMVFSEEKKKKKAPGTPGIQAKFPVLTALRCPWCRTSVHEGSVAQPQGPGELCNGNISLFQQGSD